MDRTDPVLIGAVVIKLVYVDDTHASWYTDFVEAMEVYGLDAEACYHVTDKVMMEYDEQ